jgi:hypothetical protein
MRAIRAIAATLGLVLTQVWNPALADSDAKVTLSTGIDITRGTYGGDEDIEDLYVPVSAAVDYGRVSMRLTVPYLSVTAPAGTAITGPGGEPLPGTGDIETNSGLGDISGSVTVYDVIRNRERGIALDLTGSVKFGTADEDKGLGTGETDFTVQADLLKFFDELTLLGSIGYRLRGDPADIDLEDSLLASLGGWYRFSPQTRAGVFFDYRDSSIPEREAVRELTGFVSRRINEGWRFQVYVLGGLTDSAPDWGAGLRFKRDM